MAISFCFVRIPAALASIALLQPGKEGVEGGFGRPTVFLRSRDAWGYLAVLLPNVIRFVCSSVLNMTRVQNR